MVMLKRPFGCYNLPTTMSLMIKSSQAYYGQFVYGAIDGTVTTFAVVASSFGAGINPKLILALGIANLLGDGFSMGASAYASDLTELQKDKKSLEEYKRDILATTDKVASSLRLHFMRDYGFSGKFLDQALAEALKDEKTVKRHLLRNHFGHSEIDASKKEALKTALPLLRLL